MDNPKFLQTLPSVPQGKKSPPVENYCPQLLYTWPAVTHFDQRAKEDPQKGQGGQGGKTELEQFSSGPT